MSLIKELIYTIICFIVSIFKDLCSFRNKLTVFVCVFTGICIWLNEHDTSVVIASIAFLDSYLMYYLYNRKKDDPKK